jgi:hypothetical protein
MTIFTADLTDIGTIGAIQNLERSILDLYKQNKTNSVACSPQENYTDRETATCRRS